MSAPADEPGDERLLHCSPDRTLLVHRPASGGPREVHKLLLRGSPLDAEREVAFAQRLAGLDIVEALGAGLHAATGRPLVRTRFHPGTSLDRHVAECGAMPAAMACTALLPVARTLAAMHARRDLDAPNGLCHGDVKPANLLRTDTTTLLLDFEHTGPAGSGTCAGTLGFAGPEAQASAPLTPAFDVYGLGATLHWLLTARDRSSFALALPDEELQLLVTACTSPSPTARPSAATAAEALHEIAERLANDPLEIARNALARGDLDACEAALANAPASPARADVAARLGRFRRLQARRPGLAAVPADVDSLGPEATTEFLAAARVVLRRFPQRRDLVAAVASARRRAVGLTSQLLPTIADLARKEQFARAKDRLHALARLLDTATSLPGPLPLVDDAPTAMPSMLQRAPRTCLQQETLRLEAIETEHTQLLATLHAAERELALDDAAAVVDRIGTNFGGASEAVARHRDRLHRLTFYVERAAQARSNLERLRDLAPDEDPAPLLQFVGACRDAVAHAASSDQADSRTLGLRSLHLALRNLAEEFPAVRDRVTPGLAALDRMLAKVTDEAWGLVAQAAEKLQQEPVPVRPLQLLLARLDTLRAFEALVDQPHRSRSALLDRIETLRLRIEQAQATRDRLARGAEQALAKGHWTTGLFDMERAAQHVDDGDDLQDRQTEYLRKRLAEARRRKQEVEEAQRRNHELQTRYAAMLDDSSSTTQSRSQVLREQRDCLQFLAVHSPRDRSSLYARDARDVELRLAQESAQQAESELDQCSDPEVAVRIAERAVRDLEEAGKAFGADPELPGRLSRLLEHWRRRHQALRRDLDERRETARRRRLRQRMLSGAAAALVLVVAAMAFLLRDERPVFAEGHPLAEAAQNLPRAARPAGVQLASALRRLESEGAPSPTEILDVGETAIARLLTASPDCGRFARMSFEHCCALARRSTEPSESHRLDAALERARARLVALGMDG